MSIIDDMVYLVMQNPNVTAKEIAAHLGYAEEKSVYYWLQKAGFRGLREFRVAVLRRTFPQPDHKGEVPTARDSGEPRIPLYPDGDFKAQASGLWEHVHRQAGPASFGVMLAKSEYPPLVARGDVIIVDPEAPCFQGDLMWVNVRGTMHLVRQYGKTADSSVFVDAGRPGILLSPDSVQGKVVLIVRAP